MGISRFYFVSSIPILLLVLLSCDSDEKMTLSCGHPGIPAHGVLDLSADGKAVYRCETGFFLLGEKIRQCNSSTNKWMGQLPSCVADAASGRPVFTSTEMDNKTAQMATDYFSDFGDIQNELTCAETDEEHLPWLIVDFLEIHTIVGFNLTKLGFGITDHVISGAQCGSPGQRVFQNRCYGIFPNEEISEIGLTWDLANSYCKQTGGQLFHRISENLRNFIAWELAQHITAWDSRPESYWIGLYQESDVASWKTVSGKKIPESLGFWADTKDADPELSWDNSTWPLCTGISSEKPKYWTVDSCTVEAGWICEYNVTSCGTPWLPQGIASYSPMKMQYGSGSSVSYKCRMNSSSVTRSCHSFGTWVGEEQLCDQFNCIDLEAPENGLLISNRSEFECNAGYRLEGSSRLECFQNGSWSDVTPKCIRVECKIPPLIEHGEFLLSPNHTYVGTRLLYSCQSGYTLEGSSILTCLTNGKWSNKWPSCPKFSAEPILCKELEVQNGDLIYLDDGRRPGHRVLIQCHPGFILRPVSGKSVLECTAFGQWNSSVPSCELGNVLLNTPDLGDSAVPGSGTKKNGNTISETNWAMLIAGIVGIALFIAIVGFGTALILSRRKKRGRSPLDAQTATYTATGAQTMPGGGSGHTNPVSLIYQPLPTVALENSQEPNYGPLSGRKNQNFRQVVGSSPQASLFPQAAQFLAVGSVDGKPVFYSSLPLKKQQNSQPLRGSTRIEIYRQPELEEQASKKNSKPGTTRNTRSKKSIKREKLSGKVLNTSKLSRASSSSSNPEVSPAEGKSSTHFGQSESLRTNTRSFPMVPADRRVSLESSTSESNQDNINTQILNREKVPETEIYGTRPSIQKNSLRRKPRPVSIASSIGVDNEAFSLEEIVIPETLSVAEERNSATDLPKCETTAIISASADEEQHLTPIVSELQSEILTSPLFQKLRKVHGTPSSQLHTFAEGQDSKLPEDPRHSQVKSEEGNSRSLLRKESEIIARNEQIRTSVNNPGSSRWRVFPRQMSSSPPPPPPPPPLRGDQFTIPRLSNKQGRHMQLRTDEQNVYQSLDRCSMRLPAGYEDYANVESGAHSSLSSNPTNVSVSYVIDPRCKALTEIRRTTDYFCPEDEDELTESTAEPEETEPYGNQTLYPPRSKNYPPPAKFYPADSWKIQDSSPQHVPEGGPTLGLRRVPLPEDKNRSNLEEEGVRAVYFNDAASPTTASNMDYIPNQSPRKSFSGKGVSVEVSESDGDHERPENLLQQKNTRRSGQRKQRRRPEKHGGRRGSDDRSSDHSCTERRRSSGLEEANVLLDDNALQELLESVNFELDRNFVKPVELRSYSGPSKRNHGTSRPDGVNRHYPDGPGKRIPKAAPRNSLLRVGNEESDSSPRLPAQMTRAKPSAPVSNGDNGSPHGTSHSTMWDAKKFKHRHKKVQFCDAVDEYMLSVAARKDVSGSGRPQVINETYKTPLPK